MAHHLQSKTQLFHILSLLISHQVTSIEFRMDCSIYIGNNIEKIYIYISRHSLIQVHFGFEIIDDRAMNNYY